LLLKSRSALLLVLALLLIAIVSLRFNRIENLPGIDQHQIADSPDSKNYAQMVHYFRGDHRVLPDAPFTYRPLLPFVAAALPIDNPKTALNLVNVGCLVLALFLLIDGLQAQAFSLKQQALAGLLFVVAFPTGYYGAIGYVDPGLLAAVALLNRLIQTQSWWWALLIFFVGFFVRDTMLFALPFAVMMMYQQKGKIVAFCLLMVSLILAFIAIKITRWLSINPAQVSWPIDWQMLNNNLVRPKTYLSFMLTLGLPSLLMLTSLVLLIQRTSWYAVLVAHNAYLIGWLSWIGLFVVAMLTAYADGRFVWPTVLYAIPLLLIVQRQLQANGLDNRG